MEINDTVIPSIPDATIIFSLLLHLGPVPGKAQDGETEKNQDLLCVKKWETAGCLFRFPILYFTVAGTEHTLGV